MKLLLYCTKAKPYLRDKHNVYGDYHCFPQQVIAANYLNGKIVAECDFEVEEIDYRSAEFVCNRYYLEVLDKSCLTDKQMYDYLKGENGYAIHIKNLHIFDEPKKLRDYYCKYSTLFSIVKSPQNMMYAYDCYKNPFVLISIQSQWLCKILNKEKTIEVRKKVLKEMINNE